MNPLHTCKVAVVGGPDVDSRIELMQVLSDEFAFEALGSSWHLRKCFAEAGFGYSWYPLGRGANPLRDMHTITCLWRLFRRIRPTIVHTFDTKPAVWGRLAARKAGVPIVIGTLPGLGSLYSNNNLSTGLLRAIYEPLQKWACHASDLTIFQNREDARQFIDRKIVAERDTAIIGSSGVSTDRFDPSRLSEFERQRSRRDLGISTDDIVVAMISRVIRSKGVLEFARAAQIVRGRYYNAVFVLIGPSDEKSIDRLTTSELEFLKGVVTWPGRRDDVIAVLSVSDIFVLPSAYREGIPRVLIEAASMGLALITSDSPGCNCVVEDGINGLLVPLHDSDALVQAILRLIEQPELRKRLGLASRERAVQQFDISVIAEQTRKIYQQLLGRDGFVPARAR